MGVIVCNSENAVPSFGIMSSYYDLQHHGTEGQKWGVRNGPPYPLSKGGKAQVKKQKKMTRKEAKEAAKKEKARQEAIKKKEAFEREKDKVRRTGSASEVMQYRGYWTNQELREIVERLDLEERLYSKSARQTKTAMQKIDTATKNLGTFTKAANQGISTWNTFANVYNSLGDYKGNDTRLPVINMGGEGKKDKKKNKGSSIDKLLDAVVEESASRMNKKR